MIGGGKWIRKSTSRQTEVPNLENGYVVKIEPVMNHHMGKDAIVDVIDICEYFRILITGWTILHDQLKPLN